VAECPEEMKSFQEAASAQQDLCEMLDALETTVLDLLKQRDQLRKTLEDLCRQSSIHQPNRSTRSPTGRKPPRSRAQQERKKKSDPVETPAVNQSESSDESKVPTGARNALGRTLAQLRVNRNRGHSR
jgi:cell envelope opacity-associated protein A